MGEALASRAPRVNGVGAMREKTTPHSFEQGDALMDAFAADDLVAPSVANESFAACQTSQYPVR